MAVAKKPRHTCHIPGCPVVVDRTKLMCIAHWRRCPMNLQIKVYKTYRPGQEDRGVTAEYLEAARNAVNFVVEAEKRKAAGNDTRGVR